MLITNAFYLHTILFQLSWKWLAGYARPPKVYELVPLCLLANCDSLAIMKQSYTGNFLPVHRQQATMIKVAKYHFTHEHRMLIIIFLVTSSIKIPITDKAERPNISQFK